jgi:hypothetical protein
LAGGRAPAVSDLLLRMGRQSELAAEWITTGDVPGHAGTSAPPLDAANDLLTTVVAATTQLASERDSLRRAEQSCEVADQLANTIVFTSFGEGAEDSEELGIFLGDVLEHGVMVNLSRFEPTGADDPRLPNTSESNSAVTAPAKRCSETSNVPLLRPARACCGR